jgi:hypothetical protein
VLSEAAELLSSVGFGLDKVGLDKDCVVEAPVDNERLVTTVLPVRDVVLLANGGLVVESRTILDDGIGPVEKVAGPVPVLRELMVTLLVLRELIGAVPVLEL